jgi:hypothetical protein
MQVISTLMGEKKVLIKLWSVYKIQEINQSQYNSSLSSKKCPINSLF